MKTFVSAKLHGVRVTGASVQYNGSITLYSGWMIEAGIQDYEQVQIVNLSNGNRWTTYVIPSKDKIFTLNGGGAFLGKPGDSCVIMTYDIKEKFYGAKVLFFDLNNNIVSGMEY